MSNITNVINRIGFQVKKHAPEILVTVGVVGTVASTILACKATTKLNPILEEAKANIKHVKDVSEHLDEHPDYTEEDCKKALAITYTKTGMELVKLYAPSVILGALSLASIITSNGIHRKRNTALAAAYMVVDKGFKEYRGRVIDRFGKELDQELRFDVKAKEVEEVTVDSKGKEKKVKKTVKVVEDISLGSEYARFFDDGCTGWDDDPEYSLAFLKKTQAYANDQLQRKTYLFLNDVYEMLGIHRSTAGQIVGWIYDPDNPNHKGDNYIDFGLENIHREKTRDFVNGIEKVVLLDFNVDGPIYNLI